MIRMTEAEILFGEEHVCRYRETNGEVGHIWHGSRVLLTTKGRNSGEPRTTPLAYDRVGDNFFILASNGGAPAHPGWYRNLAKEPQVEVQVMGAVFRADARTATGGERQRIWTLAARQHPDLNRCQARTKREIPVVVLKRTCAAGHDTTIRGGTG
jgi:deazaflavin-dependent oxidoreductase (nitroreductase family)